jgi:hypothetical protein
MNEKTLNRLLVIGYAGIVIAYGLLLYVKIKARAKDIVM